jgi:ATP-binding cassette subfamily F protein 3
MIEIANLTYRIDGRLLFEDASVQIPANRRVGFVGRNGAGKSTLLKLILGEIEPDDGFIRIPTRTRVGHLTQDPPSGNRSPREIVLDADDERNRLLESIEVETDHARSADLHHRLNAIAAHSAPARAARILAGLGFSEAAQQRPLDTFSGGWRMRVALAAVLFSEPDVLLLDEPTNHLDLEAATWFEGFLAKYPKTVLIVSHDRGLLNRSVDQILHLENRKLRLYAGGYDTFERTRAERVRLQEKSRQRQESDRQRMQAFIDRFRAKATKARQAQSRLKALEKMTPIDAVVAETATEIRFPAPEPASPPLLVLEGVNAGYAPGAPVLSGIDLQIDPDDRIALLGANGNGKSTLARLLSGRLAPLNGTRRGHRRLRVGYFAQHQLEELEARDTPLSSLARLLPDATNEVLRTRLGGFGFSVDKAETAIGDLSGGEKSRLLLAFATVSAPQLLVLDEPTNHLDIDAREMLIRAINEYVGAVVLISHDARLVNLCADRLWLVANGTVRVYDGTLEAYQRGMSSDARGGTAGERSDTSVTDRRQDRRSRADRRAALAPLRRKVREAESELEHLTSRRRQIEAELGDPSTYAALNNDVTGIMKD